MEKISLLKVLKTEPDKLTTCYSSGAVGDMGEPASARMSPTLRELPVVGKLSQREKPGTSTLNSASLGWEEQRQGSLSRLRTSGETWEETRLNGALENCGEGGGSRQSYQQDTKVGKRPASL